MDRSVARQEAHIDHADAVALEIIGDIAHAQHIAIFAHDGADIALAKLDQHIGFEGFQCCDHVCQQAIHRFSE